jgi:hypothetical protein
MRHQTIDTISADVILAAINGDPEAMALIAKTDCPNASLQLQPLDDEWAKSPFPWDQNALAYVKPDEMKPFLGALTDPDKLPVRTVRLNNVAALQDRVDPERVQSMVENEPEKLPVIVRLNGRKLIADGHHRMTARWLQGRKTAQVRYLDLNPENADTVAVEEERRATSDGVAKYSPDQPRDSHGQWTSGGLTESEAAGLHDIVGRLSAAPTAEETRASLKELLRRVNAIARLRAVEVAKYDQNEARDDHGRWTSGGGSLATSLKKELSADEKRAVSKYTEETYVEMNAALRGEAKAAGATAALTKAMASALKKSIVTAPGQVFRGINVDTSKFEEGSTITVKGFISTSKDEAVAKMRAVKRYTGWGGSAGTMLEINVGKGTRALDIDSSGAEAASEREVVLDHNSSFRIRSVDSDNHRVVMDLLP